MAAPMDDEDMLTANDLYSLLNVDRKASVDDINSAFRQRCKIFHPDKHIDPVRKKQAESYFNKLKRAHEDLHKRTIYDVYGEAGLETEGLEVISRTKSPAEIIAEYERIQTERERRRLQERTNPVGTVTVGIDATDLFDRYHGDDEDALYRSGPPNIEISNMTIYQSVEAPLTVKDTAIIAGTLSARNGTGDGAFITSWRRLISNKGWAQFEVGFGNNVSVSIKGFRHLTQKCYGTASCALQTTKDGIIQPVLGSVLAYRLDKNLEGKLMMNMGGSSSVTSMLEWSTQRHNAAAILKLGIHDTNLCLAYTCKFQEEESKIRLAVRVGISGARGEYGFEKKISQFSTLRATMYIGYPLGVLLRIRLQRGNQTFIFPIHLSEQIVPSAIFYGTVIPVAAYFIGKLLIIDPYLKQQREKDLEKKKEENAEKLLEKRREAYAAVELMRETVDRIIDTELQRSGLIIIKSLYGKLVVGDEGNFNERDCIDVTLPLQVLVKDSKLILPDNTTKSNLAGFYDPCIGEEKSLYIKYKFRSKLHAITLKDTDLVRIPQQKHVIVRQESSGNGGSQKS